MTVYINHLLWQKSRILIGRPRDFLPFSSLSSLLSLLAPAFVVVVSSLVVLLFSDVSVVVVGDKVEAAVVASAKDKRLVSSLFSEHLFFILKVLCNLKKCAIYNLSIISISLYREIIKFVKTHALRQGGGGSTWGPHVKLDRGHVK